MRVDRKIMSVVVGVAVAGCASGSIVRGSQNIPESNRIVSAPVLGPTVCGAEPRGLSNTFCTYGTADTPEGRQGYASACCFVEGTLVVWPGENSQMDVESCLQDKCYFSRR